MRMSTSWRKSDCPKRHLVSAQCKVALWIVNPVAIPQPVNAQHVSLADGDADGEDYVEMSVAFDGLREAVQPVAAATVGIAETSPRRGRCGKSGREKPPRGCGSVTSESEPATVIDVRGRSHASFLG